MRMKRVKTKLMIPIAVMAIGLLAGCGRKYSFYEEYTVAGERCGRIKAEY